MKCRILYSDANQWYTDSDLRLRSWIINDELYFVGFLWNTNIIASGHHDANHHSFNTHHDSPAEMNPRNDEGWLRV